MTDNLFTLPDVVPAADVEGSYLFYKYTNASAPASPKQVTLTTGVADVPAGISDQPAKAGRLMELHFAGRRQLKIDGVVARGGQIALSATSGKEGQGTAAGSSEKVVAIAEEAAVDGQIIWVQLVINHGIVSPS